MSALVICVNEINDNSGGSTFQAPYSFHNHLQQPLRIPPNSEVAVQSLKIVKEGKVALTPSTKWYEYVGEKLSASKSLEQTTSAVIPTDFGINSIFTGGVDDVADRIQVGLNKGVSNPEMYGLAKCTINRDLDGAFDGFKHEFFMRGNASSLNNIPSNWVNSFEGSGGLAYNSGDHRLTATTTTDGGIYNVAIGTNTPIALSNGEFIVDVSQTAGTSWGIGLTRSRAIGKDPDYFNPADGGMTRNPNIFCDFFIGAIQTETTSRYLRVFHAIYDADASNEDNYDPENPIGMKEVQYYNGSGSLTGEYNWSTNFSSGVGYTKVKMIVENEFITAQLWDPDKGGAWVDLIVKTGSKLSRFKPVADTCRVLYPLAFINNNRQASSDRYLTLEKYGGRDIDMKYGQTDWWGYLSENDLERKYALPVDTRPYNDRLSATTHTYKGVNASGFLDYNAVMIVEQDPNDYYVDTSDANATKILGFEGRDVLDTYVASNSSGAGYYDSNSIPDLKSTSALFVRLNNFNITTYNANRSAFSKIIYSAPRFSTGTDKTLGSLFFESPEKTYVSLNNNSEMVVNSFSIDLVNEDETLATDMTGKSVCILHFRQSPKM